MLARHGYRLRFREHDWVECLIASVDDAFEGRGLDREAALEAALQSAFPSRVARELLDVAVAAASRGLHLPSAGVPEHVSHEIAEPPGLSMLHEPSPSDNHADEGPELGPVLKSAQAGLRTREPGFVRTVDRASTNRMPPAPPARTVPLLVRSGHATLPVGRERSLEDLAILTDRIEDSRAELAWSTAPRQRLAILAWICEARSHTDVFPDDGEIREAVARVSRQLTEIGKAFWPGSVTALQLQMTPADLPRHLLGGTPATWARAAELAERALAHLEHSDERRGQDPYGWGDADALDPEPLHAQPVLQGLVSAVEAAWGPLDRFAEPRNPDDLPEPLLYQQWVRELRWIRGQDVDPDLWARVMGRLRWWACRRNGPVQAEGRELEPGFRPDRPWAEVLGTRGVHRSESPLPRELVDLVRGRFGGKKLLCLGMRRDPVEQARLTQALPDTELEWRFVEPSLLEELPAALEEGGYEAVVAAVGLQAQATDIALARGCKRAGVRYVRANRGQPIACLRGLAKVS